MRGLGASAMGALRVLRGVGVLASSCAGCRCSSRVIITPWGLQNHTLHSCGRAAAAANGFLVSYWPLGRRRRVCGRVPCPERRYIATSYALSDGDNDGGGVSRARSAARAFRSSCSIPAVSGCSPPRKRRAIRSVSSSVVTASRISSSVAPSSSQRHDPADTNPPRREQVAQAPARSH